MSLALLLACLLAGAGASRVGSLVLAAGDEGQWAADGTAATAAVADFKPTVPSTPCDTRDVRKNTLQLIKVRSGKGATSTGPASSRH